MDTQIKKGLIDICLLAVLSKGESYGYQIIKDVSYLVEVSESTLYPILRRLQTSGFVSTFDVVHNGRLRKYYKITPLGIQRLIADKDELTNIMLVCSYVTKIINEQEGKNK